MQVAALLDPDLRRGGAPRTLAEKWRQMRAAWALERTWTKEEILEAYLNLVTFRGELQGVAAAAAVLFDKAPHGLTHAESQVLAALVRAPNADRTALMQRVARSTWERGPLARRGRATRAPRGSRMPLHGSPSSLRGKVSIGNTLAPPISPPPSSARSTPRAAAAPRVALAPHAARRLMPPTAPHRATDTPLDARRRDPALRRRTRCAGTCSPSATARRATPRCWSSTMQAATSSPTSPAAATCPAARHVDGIQARPPGRLDAQAVSLRACALDRRLLTAASLLDDTPLEIAVGDGLFRPRNYDEQFRGLVSLRTALAGSLNVPRCARCMLVGPDDFAAQLRALGFAGVAQPGDYYGPRSRSASADVTLWELVNAYRTLANGGAWTRPDPLPPRRPRWRRAGPGGPLRARSASEPPRSSSPTSSPIATSRSVTFGLESPLATRFWSAVKTGTSKDMRDNWCIGYSRRYTVGVWVGNFSGEPMRDVSGITGAAPIWADVMNWLHRDAQRCAGAAARRPAPPRHRLRRRRRAARAASGSSPAPSRTRRRHGARAARRASSRRPTAAVIAIDPDIPAARQRVAFEAQSSGSRRALGARRG